MLVAYVSDERYVALPDVLLEFEGEAGSFEARSRATGSVHVDLPPALQGHASEARLRSQERAVADRCRPEPLISSGCCPTACSATPGPSG